MAKYLSVEWIDDLHATASANPDLQALARHHRLRVTETVTGAPDGDATIETRTFITEAEIIQLIHNDIQKTGERDRRFARYFTISNLCFASVESGRSLRSG